MRTPRHIWLLLILIVPGEYLYTRYIPQKFTLGRALVCMDNVEAEEMSGTFCDGVID